MNSATKSPLLIRKRITFSYLQSTKNSLIYSNFRVRRKTLLILLLLIVLITHVIFTGYHTIITLTHSQIVQQLTSKLEISENAAASVLSSSSVQMQENFSPAYNSEKPKKILIWNKYWKSRALWHKVFTQIIHGQCPEILHGNNCIFTMNRNEIETSDAVLFHLVDLHTNGEYKLPAKTIRQKYLNQLWIGMTYEPPFILNYLGFNATKLNGIFNRTMTYRKDSDIIVRHGRVLKLNSALTTSTTTTTTAFLPEFTRFPRYVSNWINSHDDPIKDGRNYSKGKRRLIAWFASSHGCTSHSKRELYVHELQKYIDVDIYGSCGQYKCGVQKTLRNPYKVEHDDCYFLVSTSYKFVLAFENSICTDYVTEKLYNNLMLNVIPIVFGGVNYTEIAPPNSIIDINKFSSPKELAMYLKLLDSNDTLYNQYFEWKKDYFIEAYDGVPMACDLCIKMNNDTWRKEVKVYERFDKWLEGNCSEGYSPNFNHKRKLTAFRDNS